MADYGSTGKVITLGRVGDLKPITIRGISLMGGPDSGFYVAGGKSTSEGSSSQPSLCVAACGFWRFRWRVLAGTHTIQCSVKQAYNVSPYPSITVKANPGVLAADVSGSAAAGSDWKTIGPLTVDVLADGVVWVELWNNLYAQVNGAPCYFDHIVVR